ncbi:MAG: chlorite dismutase family protein [Leptospirales bacterium]
MPPEETSAVPEKAVSWTEDAQALLRKVPFFIRKNVEKEAEDYARTNSLTKVDAGVIARIKSSKTDRSEESSPVLSEEETTSANSLAADNPVQPSPSGSPSEASINGHGDAHVISSRSDEGAHRMTEPVLSKDFSSFSLFRLDPSWRKLHPTEMGHGKREFHEIVKSYSNQISVFSYCLVGLNGTGDLLLWRTGTSLEALQDMTGKMLSTFFGRYLMTEKNYMGYLTQQNNRAIFTPTKSRFVHVKPIVMTSEWHQLAPFIRVVIEKETRDIAARFPTLRLTTMASYGLDESDFVLILESDSPEQLLEFNNAFQEGQEYRYISSAQRGITAISRSMSDILDLLGG